VAKLITSANVSRLLCALQIRPLVYKMRTRGFLRQTEVCGEERLRERYIVCKLKSKAVKYDRTKLRWICSHPTWIRFKPGLSVNPTCNEYRRQCISRVPDMLFIAT